MRETCPSERREEAGSAASVAMAASSGVAILQVFHHERALGVRYYRPPVTRNHRRDYCVAALCLHWTAFVSPKPLPEWSEDATAAPTQTQLGDATVRHNSTMRQPFSVSAPLSGAFFRGSFSSVRSPPTHPDGRVGGGENQGSKHNAVIYVI